MAEINEFGFERDDLSALIDNYKDKFKEAFGVDILVSDDSFLGQLATLLAERDNENQKLAEAVYFSKTLSGAEGIQLDDIYSRLGVFRLDKQPGTGVAVVETTSTISAGFTLPATTVFSATNGINYSPSSDTVLKQVVTAIKIPKAAVQATTYTATVFNTTTSAFVSLVHTVPSTSDADRLAFFTALESFLETNTTDNTAVIYTDTSDITFYAGFVESDNSLVGLSEVIDFQVSPKVGNVFHGVPVTANTNGFFELLAGGITTLSPTFTGFVSATNIAPFDPGSEVESDTEYRVRAQQIIKGTTIGTREGLIAALLNTSGVDAVTIYDNATLSDTAEAKALTFNTIVSGSAADATVAQTIFDNKPVNALTDGTTTVAITASDGLAENISFTKAVEVPVSVRVSYSTANGIPLSSSEQNTSRESIQTLFSSLNIGDDVINSQLVSSFLRSVDFSRVTDATVEIKPEADPDTSYSTATFAVAFNEFATVDDLQIFFLQV